MTQSNTSDSLKKILLLVFVHGFLGSEDSFCDFPVTLKTATASFIKNTEIHTVIYPTYETRRDLSSAVAAFSKWLVDLVHKKFSIDSKDLPKKQVDIIFLGHSMGGLLITDVALQLRPILEFVNVLSEIECEKQVQKRKSTGAEEIFVPSEYDIAHKLVNANGSTIKIVGVIAYDTPFYGISHEAISDTVLLKVKEVSTQLNQTRDLGMGLLNAFGSNAGNAGSSASVSTARNISKGGSTDSLNGLSSMLGSLFGGSKSTSAAKDLGSSLPSTVGKKNVTDPKTAGIVAAGLLTAAASVAATIYFNKKAIDSGAKFVSEHLLFVSSLYKTEEIKQRMAKATSSKMFGFHCFYNVVSTKATGLLLDAKKKFITLPQKHQTSNKLFTEMKSNLDNEVVAHMNMFDTKMSNNVHELLQETALKIKEYVYL